MVLRYIHYNFRFCMAKVFFKFDSWGIDSMRFIFYNKNCINPSQLNPSDNYMLLFMIKLHDTPIQEDIAD